MRSKSRPLHRSDTLVASPAILTAIRQLPDSYISPTQPTAFQVAATSTSQSAAFSLRQECRSYISPTQPTAFQVAATSTSQSAAALNCDPSAAGQLHKRSSLLRSYTILALAILPFSTLPAQDTLRITGSTTVAPVVERAAEHLREPANLTIYIDTQGGSSGGIQAIGSGQAHIGMASKQLTDKDRTRFPDATLIEHAIGQDAVALVVSRDVFDGGVQSITREQAQAIYEQKITNWNEIGGPDRRVVFFNKEPGRGTWEVFAAWLYGKASEAPPVNHPEVGANEEVRAKVTRTPGSISQLSASWVNDPAFAALAILDDAGTPIPPTAANIANGEYPLSRPLYVITNGEPTGAAKIMVDYLLSPQGQDLVRAQGYLAPDDLAVTQ